VQANSKPLDSEGYKTQSKAAPLGYIIQCSKAGILRDIITADRAFTILISDNPTTSNPHRHWKNGTEPRRVSVEAVFAVSAFPCC
jgi:hypothetical protein